jgi:hypothetical protein
LITNYNYNVVEYNGIQVGFPVEKRNTQSLRWAVPSKLDAYQSLVHQFSSTDPTSSSSSSMEQQSCLNAAFVKSCLSQHVSSTAAVDKENNSHNNTRKSKNSSSDLTHVTPCLNTSDNDEEVIFVESDRKTDSSGSSSSRRDSDDRDVAFYIAGRPDGISEQLDMTHTDARNWSAHTVVIEAKSRVNRISRPPPLHDLIQLTSYILMTGSVVGDLVQSIRAEPDTEVESKSKRARNNNNNHNDNDEASKDKDVVLSTSIDMEATANNTTNTEEVAVAVDLTAVENSESLNNENLTSTKGNAEAAVVVVDDNQEKPTNSDISQYTSENFDVYRLDFRSDSHRHGFHFFADVLPRLHVFKDAIATMRADDGLRYRWLMALSNMDQQTQVEIVTSLCPYVQLSTAST